MTEKDYNPEQKQSKAMKKQKSFAKSRKNPTTETELKKSKENVQEKPEEKKQKAESDEKKSRRTPETRKTEAVVKGISLPISTKNSAAVCKFIKNKEIKKAIAELEEIIKHKKALPVRKTAHKKGVKKMSGSGRYPQKTIRHFIILLKSLSSNASANGLENPVIAEAVANIASSPYGRFGRVKRKRTHVKIKAVEKKQWKKEK